MEIVKNKIARQMMLPDPKAIQDSEAKEHRISAKVGSNSMEDAK